MKYEQCPTCGYTRSVRAIGFEEAMDRMNKLMRKWHKEDMNAK